MDAVAVAQRTCLLQQQGRNQRYKYHTPDASGKTQGARYHINAGLAAGRKRERLPGGITDIDYFDFDVAGRAPPLHGVADPRSDHRLGERRSPADPAGRHVRFIITDDAEVMRLAVL